MCRSPLSLNPTALTAGSDQPAAEAKSDKVPSINDLDSIFGPVLSPKSVVVHTEDKWVNFSDPSPESVTVAPRPWEKVASPPAGAAGSPVAEPPRALPSPLRLEELQKKALEQPHAKEENAEPATSPKDFGPGQRATPPPPPPPTYRTVVSSPGPGASSGAGSPSGTSLPPPPPAVCLAALGPPCRAPRCAFPKARGLSVSHEPPFPPPLCA